MVYKLKQKLGYDHYNSVDSYLNDLAEHVKNDNMKHDCYSLNTMHVCVRPLQRRFECQY